MFWVSVLLAVVFINLMLLTDVVMALTSPLWVPARARVVSTDGFVSHARSRPYIDITYEYDADGKRYTNDKVCFLELPFGCLGNVLEEVAEYKTGDPLTIHYLPVLPQAAVIVRETEIRQWLAFMISLPITLLGSWIAFLPGWQVLKKFQVPKIRKIR